MRSPHYRPKLDVAALQHNWYGAVLHATGFNLIERVVAMKEIVKKTHLARFGDGDSRGAPRFQVHQCDGLMRIVGVHFGVMAVIRINDNMGVARPGNRSFAGMEVIAVHLDRYQSLAKVIQERKLAVWQGMSPACAVDSQILELSH